MLKELIRKTVLKLFPELAAGLHLPLLAVVTGIADPPANGEICDEFTPKYAVDCRLLKSDFTIDDAMPLMRDVPVALSGAAPDRGLAMLPQPGTIVEIAFAFGLQTHPYIRAVLPHFRKLPVIDDKTMRWQQNAASFQQVNAAGDWLRKTDRTITDDAGDSIARKAGNSITETAGGDISREAGGSVTETAESDISREAGGDLSDQAAGDMSREAEGKISDKAEKSITREAGSSITDTAAIEYKLTALQIWIGTDMFNFLLLVSEFMQATGQALESLSGHTHKQIAGPPNEQGDISAAAGQITAKKALLDTFAKQPIVPQ